SGDDVFNLIGDVDSTDEDRDVGMGDSTGVLASLDGEIFSRGKKYRDVGMGDSTGVLASLDGEIFSRGKKCQESNIVDSDNTGDGGKILGGAIGACGGIGKRDSKAKRSLVKSSKKLEEVFPGEAEK
nr:hypothetical protein [Tanacetum cinerariifolium]